jgi:hypothetical protein
MGLYVSDRLERENAQENSKPFGEPAVFVVNSDQRVEMVQISNGPGFRPALDVLKFALGSIRVPIAVSESGKRDAANSA